MSDGDVALPDYAFRPGYGDRHYRRDDSDEPGDRYRLYELAGVPHMGTRYAPFDDLSLWQATHGEEAAKEGRPRAAHEQPAPLRALRHGARPPGAVGGEGTVPPRAERLEVGPDGFFATGRARQHPGGVRCVQLDVPHSTYQANPVTADGTPS